MTIEDRRFWRWQICSDKTYVRARTMQELRLCFCCFLYSSQYIEPKMFIKTWCHSVLAAWLINKPFRNADMSQVQNMGMSGWNPHEIESTLVNIGQYWSMAMQQEPIHWWYLPYIRPIFQAYVRGYTSQKMALYGTSILGSWNSLALGCLLCPVFEYFWLWWAEQPVANGTSGVSWKCSSDQNRKRILPKVPRGEWGF